ncbi:BTAD domain-containing putative transcriptional regulator [Streptomyces sp. GC420]|uniref:AfsR/SARP family transcriptional regulator n=1 Tax=Streptomyces sp. GC420 TaxID=2697568 RepID=UPI001414E441|nr:BTAD domain-containing putative transcriptional regulator [Streptomyces sp. GC420]NBM16593.1 tetratricopeptide repeat protein [Streptomyces sp. GC420]
MVDLLALGPLELWHGGQQFALGSVKERCVLAVLIHAREKPVSVDTLLDRVWDREPPPTAVDNLHTYLSRLRGRLRLAAGGEPAGVDRVSSRLYRLRIAPERVDLTRFQRLRADAAAAVGRGDPEMAIGLLREAEALWRGEPLAEFSGVWAHSVRARLVEDHRRVREQRMGLELESGRHADLIGELRELAAQNPTAQQVVASLMLALYRSGRPEEALALYRTTRGILRERQGIEPGPELRNLHRRMLEQDQALMGTSPGAAAATTPVTPVRSMAPVPEPRNTLLRDTPDFTGRASELRILLDGAGRHGTSSGAASTALPVTVVHGMPGVGKTALALHAAHRLTSSYPDGQFYVDLFGYSGRQPLDPSEALTLLLRAAGLSVDTSASPDERAARWREWTARRRVLLVLDDAHDAAQVRPLLPGASACRALVTSRSTLAGLEGAASLHVDVLSGAEAAALFTRVSGALRRPADAADLGRVVDACGRHPLALQMLAGRFRHRESWDFRHLLDRLSRARDPLDEFDGSVLSVFRFSYAGLGEQAQRLFRLLALNPGPDITLRAAAALADSYGAPPPCGRPEGVPGRAREHDVEDGPRSGWVRRAVEELQDASLLEEPVRDRFRLHDLARAFGLRVGAGTDPEQVRRRAVERLVSYYLTGAHRADCLAHPHRRPLPLGAELESRHAPWFSGADEASVWLSVEHANLVSAARLAATDFPPYAALFPHVLATPLKFWGTHGIATELYDSAVPVLRASRDRAALARTLTGRAELLAQKNHEEALRCATEAVAIHAELGDPNGLADALLQSGRARLAAGRGNTALVVVEQALSLYREAGDRSGEAECLNVQGMALFYAGRYEEALHRLETMRDINAGLSDFYGVAKALNNMGELLSQQHRYEEARACYEQSSVLMRQHGGRQDISIVDTNLDTVHLATGQADRALGHFRRALDSHRAGGDALGEADVLISLGTTYAATGRHDEALQHFGMAQDVARSIGNPYELQRSLIGTADVHLRSGRQEQALAAYREALELAQAVGFPMGAAHALAGLARAGSLSAEGRGETACRNGERAVALYRRLGATGEAEKLRAFLACRESTGS